MDRNGNSRYEKCSICNINSPGGINSTLETREGKISEIEDRNIRIIQSDAHRGGKKAGKRKKSNGYWIISDGLTCV